MRNSQNILQPLGFILAWTLLWPVVIACVASALYRSGPVEISIDEIILKTLPVSLIGSIISHMFYSEWFPSFKGKRICVSFFWGAFWYLYLLIMMFCTTTFAPNPHVHLDGFTGAILLVLTAIFFLPFCVPPTVGIAYCASFAPMLRPKNYRGWT
jgi:hypothetical protein